MTNKTNWQIRINVFDTEENAFRISDAIEVSRLGYNVRIINIDKDGGEDDDEMQFKCMGCGRMDSCLHSSMCNACLTELKRQMEEERNDE